jgi:ribose transport system ATP-binding protein
MDRAGQNILEIRDLSKHYPGVTALKGINLSITRSSVHCIVGENGAGKSTFIKILSGAVARSGGTILFNGEDFRPRNTNETIAAGLSMIFQELNIIEQLTVEENLTLGMEKSWLGIVRRDPGSSRSIAEALKSLDPGISLSQHVAKLSVAQKQIVEIARAIAVKASLIIMDEPTAALSEDEVKRLFEIVRALKRQDVTIIYITHKLEEVFQIGDRVTVFRDGDVVDTLDVSAISADELIRMMVGRVVAEEYHPNPYETTRPVLQVKDLGTRDKLHSISFELFKSEILGFYGLVGSGKTEIARAVCGADRYSQGAIHLDQATLRPRLPIHAIRKGIALVPEERREQGIFPLLSLRENISIMSPAKYAQMGITRKGDEKRLGEKSMRRLGIVAFGTEQRIATLSGGNQQKAVVAKCLNADPRILVMDEPTRGVDVGAKAEIHQIIRQLAKDGNSILLFSSELPEILNLADRIVLLYEGRIEKVFRNGERISGEEIMQIVTGGKRSQ